MKVNKIHDLKTNFSFEAPCLPASAIAGRNSKVSSDLLDLNDYLAPDPKNIYMVRVNGESMIDEGIYDGDVLIVNRNEEPKDGLVVIAALNGETAVKSYRVVDGKTYLYSANEKFLPIEIQPYWQFDIQGVVKFVIHNV